MDLSKLVVGTVAIALCFAITQIKVPQYSKFIAAEVKSISYPSPDLIADREKKSTVKVKLILFVPAIDIGCFVEYTSRDRLVPLWLYLPENKIRIFGKITDINLPKAYFIRQLDYPVYLAFVEGKIEQSKVSTFLKNNLINTRIAYKQDRTVVGLVADLFCDRFGFCNSEVNLAPQLSAN